MLSAWLAPPSLGPWWGMAIGFGYLVMSWFLAGVYLSDVMHMGITHGALDYKEWFIKGVTLVNNTVGVYVDPVSWVNRHRLHHRFADHARRSEQARWRRLLENDVPLPVSLQDAP